MILEKKDYKKTEWFLYNNLELNNTVYKLKNELSTNNTKDINSFIRSNTNSSPTEREALSYVESEKIQELERWIAAIDKLIVWCKSHDLYDVFKFRYIDKRTRHDIEDHLFIGQSTYYEKVNAIVIKAFILYQENK